MPCSAAAMSSRVSPARLANAGPLRLALPQPAETNEPARAELAVPFDRWEGYLREGLVAMHAHGELRARRRPR